MIGFMMSVLGSFIFWAGFFLVGFLVTSRMYKILYRRDYDAMRTGKDYWGDSLVTIDYVTIVFKFGGIFITWPLIIICWVTFIVTKGLFSKVIWPLFCKIVLGSEKLVPNFKIVKGDD